MESFGMKFQRLFIILLTVSFAALQQMQLVSSSEENHVGSLEERTEKEVHSNRWRRLQFENMFEPQNNPQPRRSRKKKVKRGAGQVSRAQQLSKAVEEILLEADRYHQWWTGPPPEQGGDSTGGDGSVVPVIGSDVSVFRPAQWAAQHNPSAQNVLFTMAVMHGKNDTTSCSSPNDLILYLGTARQFIPHTTDSGSGDIVIALEADVITAEIKAILSYYKAVVYVLPHDLCSKATDSIFCGSEDERVPSSVFRYYFYERWAALYSIDATILITDFRDIIFQANPFSYHRDHWFPDYQLVVFQEFHPNMVINRCRFNKRIMEECFGEEALKRHGGQIIVSSGAVMGTRDATIVWSHHMTMLLQDAPGRMVNTRCISGGIDHSFINWLVYGNKLRQLIRIRMYPHGEGAVNSLGGLRPDTVIPIISGDLGSFWKVLSKEGFVINWNGEIAPVVHQLDHFLTELMAITDAYLLPSSGSSNSQWYNTSAAASLEKRYKKKNGDDFVSHALNSNTGSKQAKIPRDVAARQDRSNYDDVDRAWQALTVSRCLFDCIDSVDFSKIKV